MRKHRGCKTEGQIGEEGEGGKEKSSLFKSKFLVYLFD